MNKYIVILSVLINTLLGCKKNNHDVRFNGVFTETVPIAGRTQLNFIGSNHVIVTGIQLTTSNSLLDTDSYQIINNKIRFISTSASKSDTGTFLFRLQGKDSLVLNPCTCLCPCANGIGIAFVK